MMTLRQSWPRGPRCQRWWVVTQKTQAMMLNRTVTGSLMVTHKKGVRGHRGPRAETYSVVRSRARDRCHRWGGRGSQRVVASTLLTGGCKLSKGQCRKVFVYHFLEFLECCRVHVQLPLQILTHLPLHLVDLPQLKHTLGDDQS